MPEANEALNQTVMDPEASMPELKAPVSEWNDEPLDMISSMDEDPFEEEGEEPQANVVPIKASKPGPQIPKDGPLDPLDETVEDETGDQDQANVAPETTDDGPSEELRSRLEDYGFSAEDFSSTEAMERVVSNYEFNAGNQQGIEQSSPQQPAQQRPPQQKTEEGNTDADPVFKPYELKIDPEEADAGDIVEEIGKMNAHNASQFEAQAQSLTDRLDKIEEAENIRYRQSQDEALESGLSKLPDKFHDALGKGNVNGPSITNSQRSNRDRLVEVANQINRGRQSLGKAPLSAEEAVKSAASRLFGRSAKSNPNQKRDKDGRFSHPPNSSGARTERKTNGSVVAKVRAKMQEQGRL